jgi:hypothetical protein
LSMEFQRADRHFPFLRGNNHSNDRLISTCDVNTPSKSLTRSNVMTQQLQAHPWDGLAPIS